MKIAAKKIASKMRQRRLKVTPQRRAILDAIADSPDHLTPAEIHKRVRRKHRDIGLATVYRTIEMLANMGLICEVHAGGAGRSYLLRRPSEHHHHLVCSGCGTVVDFTSCDLGDLEQKLSHDTGFDISGHLLEFSGRCRSCQAMTP